MRRMRCYECGKLYDFDEDDFCPKCGAFSQPQWSTAIGADGAVVRADGLNEANHERSFVHSEYHEENRKRRGSELARGSNTGRIPQRLSRQSEGSRKKNSGVSLLKIIIAVIALSTFFEILCVIVMSVL